MPEYYQIKVKGHLDPRWSDWFAGFALTHLEGGDTLLSGSLLDQAALHGILERIRDINLKLISVTSGGPSTRKGGSYMKTMVVSYSMTGNNRDLAASLAAMWGAEHVEITEPKARTMGTIVWDVLLNRTPKIVVPIERIRGYDLVIFVGPVWMGQVAAPFRACFKQLGPEIAKYAFISICGGADGPNPKLADELAQRLGKEPACVVVLHIADLLPADPKPARKDTMSYRITEGDVEHLTDMIVATLCQTVVDLGVKA